MRTGSSKAAINLIALIVLAIALGGANIGGVGYSIYLWGPGNLPIGQALWGGFKLWVSIGSIGAVSLVVYIATSR